MAPKLETFGKELQIISSKEYWDDIVVYIEVMDDGSVGDWGVGLTMLAVVVVEMQDETSHQWEIW